MTGLHLWVKDARVHKNQPSGWASPAAQVRILPVRSLRPFFQLQCIKFKQGFHQICRLLCSLWIQIDNGLQNPRLWFRATFQTRISSHTSFNKLLTVDLMVRWTPGSVVLIPAMNSNTWFHRKLRLLCSLWIKNNGPLDSSTHGFDPVHEFKHVISSNMPSIFAHCGFNNGPMDSRTQGFDPGHEFKHVIS